MLFSPSSEVILDKSSDFLTKQKRILNQKLRTVFFPH